MHALVPHQASAAEYVIAAVSRELGQEKGNLIVSNLIYKWCVAGFCYQDSKGNPERGL